MKNKAEILKAIKKEAEYLEIPETLSPEYMQKKIKQQEAQKAAKKKKENLKSLKEISIINYIQNLKLVPLNA